VYYQVSLDEELAQVNRAVKYYLDWAEEYRSTTYEWDLLRTYYGGLRDPTQVAAIRFRALFFAMRLQPVLSYVSQFINEHGCPPRILDLGCGFGLESLLICLGGAAVHGLDGWQPMVEYAQKRMVSYQEKHNLRLDLRYEHKNLFHFEPSEPYDAVYSSATLHHIEPVADAFRKIAALIKPGGYFFLSDENGYSPIQQIAVQKKIGWIKPRKYLRTNPDTGEKYWYGNENIRAPFQWASHMRHASLYPVAIKYCRFLPAVDWPVEKLVKAERDLRNLPVIAQLLAIGFLFTAQKATA
jgi:SAM-dependent methyltransferase